LQRQFELNDDSTLSSVLLGPSITGDIKVEELASMISDVRGIIQKLTTGKLHHLQVETSVQSYTLLGFEFFNNPFLAACEDVSQLRRTTRRKLNHKVQAI